MNVLTTKANFVKYNMHDVFTVVVRTPSEADPDIETFTFYNLFVEYSMLTVEQVTNSDNFYSTLTELPDRETFRQNLRSTSENLQFNCEDRLHRKIEGTYNKFLPREKGGTLYFIIMMDILQSSSEEAAKYLIKTVKGIKITDYDGENVETIVGLIRGAVYRLQNLRSGTNPDSIPTDFVEDIVNLFQTSSVERFNRTFALIDIITRLTKLGGTAWKPTIENILSLAYEKYRRLYSIGEWTGVTTKINQSSFYPSTNIICFNCGGPHSLPQCQKPREEKKG